MEEEEEEEGKKERERGRGRGGGKEGEGERNGGRGGGGKEGEVQLQLTASHHSYKPIVNYIDDQFEAYLQEELKVKRSPPSSSLPKPFVIFIDLCCSLSHYY